MLNDVKLALRVTGTTFDTELQLLINDCIAEMTSLGITNISTTTEGVTTYDAQCEIAVIAYCKWKFGFNDESDKWEKIYHEKIGQLKIASGHTDYSSVS